MDVEILGFNLIPVLALFQLVWMYENSFYFVWLITLIMQFGKKKDVIYYRYIYLYSKYLNNYSKPIFLKYTLIQSIEKNIEL